MALDWLKAQATKDSYLISFQKY